METLNYTFLMLLLSFGVSAQSFECGDQIEVDKRFYRTVQICEQCWFQDNLDRGEMILGSESPTQDSVLEKYCFDDNPENCLRFGALYTYKEIMETSDVCPSGWRVATDADFQVLESNLGLSEEMLSLFLYEYRGIDQGSQLASGNGEWRDGNLSRNHSFGKSNFRFTPSGYRYEEKVGNRKSKIRFLGLNDIGYLWTMRTSNDGYGIYRYINWSAPYIGRRYNLWESFSMGVRCIKE